MQTKTKQLTVMAMICAMAILLTFLFANRFVLVPSVPFLQYDPKDIIITIGGFLLGPLSVILVSIVSSVLEMLTISDTDIIGMIMNVVSTCAFACTAATVYQKKRDLKGAMIGLFSAWFVMTVVMLLWNYFLTPLYMKVPRETVVGMLLPGFLPFNLIKGGLNAGATMLLYKPITVALRKSGLMPPATNTSQAKINLGLTLLAVVVIITCVTLALLLNGAI